MSSKTINSIVPSAGVAPFYLPATLPHGLISPPQAVREKLAEEKAKHSSGVFNGEAEERILNEWTLDYYFDNLGHEVVYRRTPAGPDVVAVGEEELIQLKSDLPAEEQLKLDTWMS